MHDSEEMAEIAAKALARGDEDCIVSALYLKSLIAERDALAAQVAAAVPLINMLGDQGHDSADTLRAAAAWLKAAGRE